MDYKNLFKSAFFFSKLLLFKQEYDVVFLYRNTFVRKDGTNHLLKPFIDSCQKHGYSYLLLESSGQQKSSDFDYLRSKEAVPFEFIDHLKLIFRKLFSIRGINCSLYFGDKHQWFKREEKVAKVLQKLFFKNLKSKLFITLEGKENIAFLKIIYPNILFAEYQHGIFWCKQDVDLVNLKYDRFQREILNQNTIYLVFGEGFIRVQSRCQEASRYIKQNIKVIGSYFPIPKYALKQNSKTILYTLQNVAMDNYESYYQVIRELIAHNAEFLQQNGYSIIFKNHPRYERDDPLLFEEEYPFISFVADDEPMNMLDDISIHITSKSTTALDVALHSVPTIFIDMLDIRSPKRIFFEQYHYPLTDFRVEKPYELERLLERLEDQNYYGHCAKEAYAWALDYYQDFDEQVFLDLIIKSQNSRDRSKKIAI